jgi:hypothetical protein
MTMAEQAEAQNEGTEARQLRPDKRTVTGTASNGTEFSLICRFDAGRAILRSQRCGGEVLRPNHVLPKEFCGGWEHAFEISPLR